MDNQYLIEYFEQSAPIIQLIWITSSIIFLIIIALIINLKYLRGRLSHNEKIESIYKKKFETDLINYIYSENEGEEFNKERQLIVSEFKKSASNTFKRKIMITTFIKLRNEISGEVAESIKELYYQTDLISDALTKLKSKKWEIIALGIRQLKQFHVTEMHEEVAKYINHPKKEVRNEIQLYLVDLFHFKGLEFLNTLEKPLSEWNQIQLLEILQRFDDQEISDIQPWLKSSNDTIVIFALKLAEIYNQYESKDTLIDLLNHPNTEIRVKTIHVLTRLNVAEAKTVLMLDFENLAFEEQIAFFKMLEYIPDTNDVHFISNHAHHANFEIQSMAMGILRMLHPVSFDAFKTESKDPKFLKIVEFIENT